MSSITDKIHALGAALDIAKQKAQISTSAALNDVNNIIREFVILRGNSPNQSQNIFDVGAY